MWMCVFFFFFFFPSPKVDNIEIFCPLPWRHSACLMKPGSMCYVWNSCIWCLLVLQSQPEPRLVTVRQSCTACSSGPAMTCTTPSTWSTAFRQISSGVSKPNQRAGNYMDQVRRTHTLATLSSSLSQGLYVRGIKAISLQTCLVIAVPKLVSVLRTLLGWWINLLNFQLHCYFLSFRGLTMLACITQR